MSYFKLVQVFACVGVCVCVKAQSTCDISQYGKEFFLAALGSYSSVSHKDQHVWVEFMIGCDFRNSSFEKKMKIWTLISLDECLFLTLTNILPFSHIKVGLNKNIYIKKKIWMGKYSLYCIYYIFYSLSLSLSMWFCEI